MPGWMLSLDDDSMVVECPPGLIGKPSLQWHRECMSALKLTYRLSIIASPASPYCMPSKGRSALQPVRQSTTRSIVDDPMPMNEGRYMPLSEILPEFGNSLPNAGLWDDRLAVERMEETGALRSR